MKHYSRMQYISDGGTAAEQYRRICQALDHGADWIQLRWKTGRRQELLALSEAVVRQCRAYGATCIINDSVAIAHLSGADGVHLGLQDEPVSYARNILGPGKIIGGTANTVDDVAQRINEGCDYIGLGPYRFTQTKQQLSPILGLEGYVRIINSLHDRGIALPRLYAIGGIAARDVKLLRRTGVYGIAVSGLVNAQPQLISTLKTLLT